MKTTLTVLPVAFPGTSPSKRDCELSNLKLSWLSKDDTNR
ncbi:hypothetical protein KVMX100_100004 [Klebsiella variicola]|nr:hypothetical protein KVMX100_100004 [Klebsiella variicola]